MQQFAVKIPINSDNFPIINFPVIVNDVVAVIETPAEDITLNLDSEELHYLCQETNRPTLGVNWDYLGWVCDITVRTSLLYYCTYYYVSLTCTVHCTHCIYCTLYILYMFPSFPVSHVCQMLKLHLQHLFTHALTLHT